jgi:xanthine dehydrogenase FAD-binding subunit
MNAVETINPTNLAQALKAKAAKDVVAIAGGTDMLVRLHDRLTQPWPKLLILESVQQLHKIIATKTAISIGPLTTFTEIEDSSLLRKHAPQLVAAAALAGSVQIRNRATIGGNIANGSPAGDTIPPLYVLGAVIEISSAKGKRSVPIERFFTGPGKTVLKPAELITAIKIPRLSNHGFFTRLATRRALAISKVSVAASIMIKKSKIESARIALGAVAPTVIRATRTEDYLASKEITSEVIAEAARIIKEEARPIDDIRSLAIYRKEMVGVLLTRGLESMVNNG